MNVKLRPWTIEDIISLATYANNYNISKFLRDVFPYPYTIEDAKAFIEFASKEIPVNNFAIDVNGEAVGGIGIHPMKDIHQKNAELGYWLAEPFWGKGIMSKAIDQVLNYAFVTYEINRVFATPFSTNSASIRVLEKAGFILEGQYEKTLFKNGAYFDELVYAVRR